jgi:hypothetical protein
MTGKIIIDDKCRFFDACQNPARSDTWVCVKSNVERGSSCITYHQLKHIPIHELWKDDRLPLGPK